jgi:hypothetical protein
MDKITEKTAKKLSGFLALFLVIVLFAIDIYLLATGIRLNNPEVLWFFIPLLIITLICLG